jgi:uncharacterized peroxidase-related enzyme
VNQKPRITPVEHATPLLDEVQAALGATPNMTRAMAASTVLEGWLRFNGALRKGAVGAADGERIALAVAEANKCAYCLSAHGYLAAHVAKLDGAEIERARDFASAEARAAAVLAFAAAVLNTRGGVSDADVERARDAGVGDAELAEIVGHVALNVLTNYFNKAFAVDIDFPRVEPRRLRAAA